MRMLSKTRYACTSNVVLLLFVFFASVNICASSVAQTPSELVTVGQIRALRPEQAAKEQPVRLRGVVTVLSGWKSSFFFQDSTSGISVDRRGSDPELQAGQLIEIEGVTQPGKFAPVVLANTVKILGPGKMPPAKLVGMAELSGGTLDSQWATIQGIVHRAEVKQVWGRNALILDVDIGGGTLVTARVRDFDPDSWRRLPTSLVSLRGVCGSVFNERRQFIALRFFVSSQADVKVLRPGPKDLFDRPVTEISNIGRFRSRSTGLDLFRIRGTVTSVQSDGKVYLQNGPEAVLVQTNHQAAFARGSMVEVVGYVRDGDYSPALEEAAVRPVSADLQAVKPVTVSAAEFIDERDGFVSSPYDSALVSVKGILQQIVAGSEDSILFLLDGKTVFTARLPHSEAKHAMPAMGSLVEVTGICGTIVDNGHEPKRFRILLRSASDVAVLRAAPWWSADHAKTVVMVMAVVLAVLFSLLMLFQRESNLRQLSLSDPLTGIHNRRGFVLLASRHWRSVLRKKTAMLVFYIDVDRFKAINDLLGHKQGDIAIQAVADILRECFRKSDIVGRIGGDEFAVVACDADADSKAELEGRLSGLVAQMNRRLGGAFELSLSVGTLLCDSSMAGLSIEDLLARTDALMYEQKTKRRRMPTHVQAFAGR